MPIAVLPDTLRRSDVANAARRGFGRLATFAAVYTYALIAVGGIVRITGSGLGCGDDWPRCHGQWIPPFTFETVIEYAHRLLAAGISFVVLAVVVQALRRRRMPGFSGRGGLLRPALLAGVFLVVQVLLGGITVMLKLPAAVTILHLGTAMALLATLLVAAIRAGALGGRGAAATAVGAEGARKVARSALGAAALGYLVVLMGALVANTGAPVSGAPSAAALACQGFPLCNGGIGGGGIVHIQLTHRILAYLLFFHVIGAVVATRKRSASLEVERAATATLVLVVLQLGVAAAMVTMVFPPSFRAAHLVVGAAVWSSLVIWTTLARRAAA